MASTVPMSALDEPLTDRGSDVHMELRADRAVSEPSAADPHRSKAQTLLILSGLFLALFLSALDFTIVGPALPTICDDLHSAAGYTWIGSSYLLANASMAPVWGKLSDIWGRKPILLTTVAVFFVGSLICALAVDIAMLIAGRAVQGSAAGGIVILVNVCISDMFSIRERGFYLGLTGIIWTLAGGIGPVIGGSLAQDASWRWLWWINLPVCGAAFAIILLMVKLKKTSTALIPGLKRIDWLGSFSIVGFAVMFLLGLDFGGIIFSWSSPNVICLIIFGLAMIVLFIFSEARIAKYPIMPLQLFQNRSNAGALLVTFCHGFTYISASYFLPIYFQAVGQQSPVISGVMILPTAVVQSTTGIAAGYYMKRTGRYLDLIRVGMTLLTLGFGLFIDLNQNFSIGKCCTFQIVAGLGIGLVFNSPLIALQKNVDGDGVAAATATFGFIRNIATALSVVLGGVVFQNGMNQRQGFLTAALGYDLAAHFSGADAGASVKLISMLSSEQTILVRTAYSDSLQNIWILYTVMAAFGLAMSTMVDRKHLSVD